MRPLQGIVVGIVALCSFMVLWTAVTGLLAYVSGWPALAAAYRCMARPPGASLRGQVIALGLVRERNVTYLILTASGLYLYPLWPFRFMRPPLLVPWKEVRYLDSRQIFWLRSADLDLGGLARLRVRPGLLPELTQYGVAIPSDALPG